MDGNREYLQELKSYIKELEDVILSLIDSRFMNKQITTERTIEIYNTYRKILNERSTVEMYNNYKKFLIKEEDDGR